MKILLVEDDPAIQSMLVNILIDHHYQVEVTGDGRSALELVRESEYDLLLLDINIPELDGISVCKSLRRQGCQIPILLLTAKDAIADRIIGLDAGADDYAIKPFNVSELLARIRALLRRGITQASVVSWERLQLNCLTQEISYADRVLRLTPKEYGILELLLVNPQRIFSRAALIARLWELETTPIESVINSHIKSIRQKLKAAGATQDLIETMHGFGYRLRQIECVALPDPVETPTQAEVVDSLMLELWSQFKDSFSEQIDLLATTAMTLTTSVPTPSPLDRSARLDAARQVAHKLIGSLGVYGFDRGSSLARQIEDLLNPHLNLGAADIHQLTRLIAQLQQELGREPVFAKPVIDRVLPSPSPINLELDRSHSRGGSQTAKVMVVDDDLAILHQLSVVLSPWGLQVIPLIDRLNFWAQLTDTAPDLLILDIEMPEVSGIELCQSVRNHPQWGNLPIIFITAAQDPATIIKAFAVGGDDYIHKPLLEPEAIARVLNQLVPQQLRRQQMSKILARVHE